MKTFSFLMAIVGAVFSAAAATPAETVVKADAGTYAHGVSATYVAPDDPAVVGKLSDWRDRKFGIMFHWGLYSVPGIAESWALCSEDRFTHRRKRANKDITDYGDFKKWYWGLADGFNPVHFDPYEWAGRMADWGFRYMIFTTKHHDGFCMFDTELTDFKITNTPFGKSPYADAAFHLFKAFREKDFMIGAYFSKPDWHNENYWDPSRATPDRNPNYDTAKYPRKWGAFRDFAAGQIDELMSRYGRIDILWLDGGWVRSPGQDLGMDSIIDRARAKQPGLIAVDRTVAGRNENYKTPEQRLFKEQQDFPWETCICLANTWGWNPSPKYKSAFWVINTLAEVVAKGGNLALNVGPDGYGRFDREVYDRLSVVGDWLKRNGEAIYSTVNTPAYNNGNTWFTDSKDGRYRYAVVSLDDNASHPSEIVWDCNAPKGKVVMLNNGKTVKYSVDGSGRTRLTLPKGTPAEPLAFKFTPRSH